MRILIFLKIIAIISSFCNGQQIQETEWYKNVSSTLNKKIETDNNEIWQTIKDVIENIVTNIGITENNIINGKEKIKNSYDSQYNNFKQIYDNIISILPSLYNECMDNVEWFNDIKNKLNKISSSESTYEQVNLTIDQYKVTIMLLINDATHNTLQKCKQIITWINLVHTNKENLQTYYDKQWTNKFTQFFNQIENDTVYIKEEFKNSINMILDRVEKKLEDISAETEEDKDELINDIKKIVVKEIEECYSSANVDYTKMIERARSSVTEYEFIFSQITQNVEFIKLLIYQAKTSNTDTYKSYYENVENYMTIINQAKNLRATKITEEGEVLVGANEYLPVYEIPKGEIILSNNHNTGNNIIETFKTEADGIQKRLILVVPVNKTTERIFETVLINSDIKSEDKYIYYHD